MTNLTKVFIFVTRIKIVFIYIFIYNKIIINK